VSLELAAWIAAGLAGLPALLLLVNLPLLRTPRRPAAAPPPVSVLVPARDEEASIGDCVESALASEGVELELVVLDDHSSDRTAEIVRGLAERDSRVRLESAPDLPAGWNGKQHACAQLARHARHELLCFLDADVRLEPEGLLRLAGAQQRSGAALVSGFPRELTGTLGEALVVPLIHLVLLGYLPLPGLKWTRRPSFAAACGQLVLVRREDYERAGGHAAIRASRHDGVTLPRAFRRAGLSTDLLDATSLARCRMYRGFAETFAGFAKNATEGMATPTALLPWTALLLGGHVLPFVLLAPALLGPAPEVLTAAALGSGLSLGARLLLALRFRQSLRGALLHPVGVAIVVAIQWSALARKALGRQVAWKGRTSS
jgi:hypothetical protein